MDSENEIILWGEKSIDRESQWIEKVQGLYKFN